MIKQFCSIVLRRYLILGLILLSIVCLRSLYLMCTLHENVGRNTELIQENKNLIVKVSSFVSRIDKEQKRRKNHVESIPILYLKMIPSEVEAVSGIIKTDIKGMIKDVSSGIEILAKRDEDELVGTNISDLITGCDLKDGVEDLKDIPIDISNKKCLLNRIFVKSEEVYIINIKES